MGDNVGENPAPLRAAVFSLSSKNLRGAFKRPPLSRARVKTVMGQTFSKLYSNLDNCRKTGTD